MQLLAFLPRCSARCGFAGGTPGELAEATNPCILAPTSYFLPRPKVLQRQARQAPPRCPGGPIHPLQRACASKSMPRTATSQIQLRLEPPLCCPRTNAVQNTHPLSAAVKPRRVHETATLRHSAQEGRRDLVEKTRTVVNLSPFTTPFLPRAPRSKTRRRFCGLKLKGSYLQASSNSSSLSAPRARNSYAATPLGTKTEQCRITGLSFTAEKLMARDEIMLVLHFAHRIPDRAMQRDPDPAAGTHRGYNATHMVVEFLLKSRNN